MHTLLCQEMYIVWQSTEERRIFVQILFNKANGMQLKKNLYIICISIKHDDNMHMIRVHVNVLLVQCESYKVISIYVLIVKIKQNNIHTLGMIRVDRNTHVRIYAFLEGYLYVYSMAL